MRELDVTSWSTLSDSLDDDRVQDFIEDASQDVIEFTAHQWGPSHYEREQYDAYWSSPRNGKIQLKHTPVIAVDKVEWWATGAWQSNAEEGPPGSATTAGDYTYILYKDEGVIAFNFLGVTGPGYWRVTYTAGEEEVPVNCRRAAAAIAALYIIGSISGKAVARISQNGVQLSYSRGWEYGQLANMLAMRANSKLSRLRKMIAVVGVATQI
jgi:hypothetical protein